MYQAPVGKAELAAEEKARVGLLTVIVLLHSITQPPLASQNFDSPASLQTSDQRNFPQV